MYEPLLCGLERSRGGSPRFDPDLELEARRFNNYEQRLLIEDLPHWSSITGRIHKVT